MERVPSRLDDHRAYVRRNVTLCDGQRREIHINGQVIVWTCRKVRGRLVDEFDLPPGARILTPAVKKD